MKVVYIKDYTVFQEKDMVLALGFFDGFHLGHQQVLNKALEIGKEKASNTGILTFNESAYDFITHVKSLHLLTTYDKINEAEKMGFDAIYIIELTEEFLNLDKDKFIDIFLRMQKALVCGDDYTFGYMGEGNKDYLEKALPGMVYSVPLSYFNKEKIGTRGIKDYLQEGKISEANEALGRTYYISGTFYKRNKNYAMATYDSVCPKNGEYNLELDFDGRKISFKGKIKKIDDANGIVIKTDDQSFNKLSFTRRKFYHLFFTK